MYYLVSISQSARFSTKGKTNDDYDVNNVKIEQTYRNNNRIEKCMR